MILRIIKNVAGFFFFIVLASCISPSHVQPSRTQDNYNYCDLLHVSPPEEISHKSKPFLGILYSEKETEDQPSSLPCKTFIQVEDVIESTPAMKAGLKEKDLILAVNGSPVCRDGERSATIFKKMIEDQEAGSAVKIDVLRDKEQISVSAVLQDAPLHHQDEAEHNFSKGCTNRTSMLEKALREKNALPAFQKILSDLHLQSDKVHNPGWFYKDLFNPFQLKELTYMLRHPLEAGKVSRQLTRELTGLTDKPDRQMAEIINKISSSLDIDVSFPEEEKKEISLPNLIDSLKITNERIEHALQSLSPDDRKLLKENALKFQDKDQWNKMLQLSLKVDLRELTVAFTPVLYFLGNDSLKLLKQDIIIRFGNENSPVLYEEMSPIGKIIVGGAGPNIYHEDAALILDLGGDDIYLNNAGGSRPGMNTTVVIDWEGNDIYQSGEAFSQGAGFLGGGFLMDLGGNDTFSSLDGSQGAGFWGIGLLRHNGSSSSFTSRSYSQGIGQMGIGLIWNNRGDDIYTCLYYGQGVGLFGGAGVLLDASGNDYYKLGGLEPDFRDPSKSSDSMGQGFGRGMRPGKGMDGIAGGIGMLIDQNGNDTYIADYFAQGSSYFFGIGILNDWAGDDRYIAGRYAQGAGIHQSAGVFIDQAGDDSYYSSFGVSQGLGHDYGAGYFEDSSGDDRYIGGILMQGAATYGGVGLMLDLTGKDTYECKNSCQAFAEDDNCAGILIDMEPNHDFLNHQKSQEKIRVMIRQNP